MKRRPRIAKIPLSFETMKSLTTALKDTVNGRYAPIIIREERLRICASCPYGGEKRRCDMCGCGIKVKASLSNSKCPLKKWPSASRNS